MNKNVLIRNEGSLKCIKTHFKIRKMEEETGKEEGADGRYFTTLVRGNEVLHHKMLEKLFLYFTNMLLFISLIF